MFKNWEDMSALEQAAILYSDMHKDAYGFRPREGGIHKPETLADYEAAFAEMGKTIARNEAEEAERATHATAQVEAEIAAIASQHGLDRATALRWWFEAEGYAPCDYGTGMQPDWQGAEHILWKRGCGLRTMDSLVEEFMPRPWRAAA